MVPPKINKQTIFFLNNYFFLASCQPLTKKAGPGSESVGQRYWICTKMSRIYNTAKKSNKIYLSTSPTTTTTLQGPRSGGWPKHRHERNQTMKTGAGTPCRVWPTECYRMLSSYILMTFSIDHYFCQQYDQQTFQFFLGFNVIYSTLTLLPVHIFTKYLALYIIYKYPFKYILYPLTGNKILCLMSYVLPRARGGRDTSPCTPRRSSACWCRRCTGWAADHCTRPGTPANTAHPGHPA